MDGETDKSSINDLDCLFCGRWFPTFNKLSEHVKRAHASARDGDVTGAVARALDWAKESDMALPKPTVDARTEQRARRGPRQERRDFLKADHVGKVGTRATIQFAGNVRIVDGNYGEQLVVDCEYDGKPYVFATNLDTPNYALLVERFTDDETKWFGPVDLIVKQGVSTQYLIVADDNASGQSQNTTPRRRRRAKA